MVVSLLHTVLDLLAFKNDISFWRKTNTFQGLSVRSVGINVSIRTIVFLYLIDNDASWMVLGSSGLSLVIDVWKLIKVARGSGEGSGYRDHTGRWDRIAVHNLMHIVTPLALGWRCVCACI